VSDVIDVDAILKAREAMNRAGVPSPRFLFMDGKWYKLVNGEWVEQTDINSGENFK